MKEVDGKAKTIQELLANKKYTLDYYQREYSWQTKHVIELIDDLVSKFYSSYEDGHDRSQVSNYSHYFLGSIIICEQSTQRFIIDGQQRLTTLTLILIRLHQLLDDEDQKSQIAPLIFSQSLGEKSFNLDISDRKNIMENLYSGEFFNTVNESESICNIAGRYEDIENNLKITKAKLPYFVDWMLERVYFVEITAYTDDDAYTIFETMNDRGLSLSPADMLRGYILSKILDNEKRSITNKIWSECVQKIKQYGKEEESDTIKVWLRSQYAEDKNKDFDKIGSEFHRWVQSKEADLRLKSSDDYANFIQKDFSFYSHWYLQLRKATKELTKGYECVFYNAQHNFTLQYPVLLAPLCIDDKDNEIFRKIQIVATYLDVFIQRRIWNYSSIAQRDLNTLMFSLMREIRGKSVNDLRNLLFDKINEDSSDKPPEGQTLDLFPEFDFGFEKPVSKTTPFRLHSGNSKPVRLILARITDYVEVQSGKMSRYLEYVSSGNNSYEVEHIWSNHYERHKDEFSHKIDFQDYRNCIGGLILLPKKVNASLGDSPYNKKREHYLRENLLAQSLHEKAYENNPGFMQFINKSQLPFKPHSEFKKVDLDTRQDLIQNLLNKSGILIVCLRIISQFKTEDNSKCDT